MIDWLAGPIDPSRAHEVGAQLSWHARSMTLAWGVLAPLGVLAARFFKVLPWQDWPRQLDSRLWWNTHRAAQYGAGALSAVGLWLILSAPGPAASLTAWAPLHRALGWAVLALAAVQFASAWARGAKGGPTDPKGLRGDHYDMTPRRRAFEVVHKGCGAGALGLGLLAILTGLWQANGPLWMWLALGGWWAGLAALAVRLQRRGRAVDTYQAIWGPDPSHPGNRRAPIGWGVRRPRA